MSNTITDEIVKLMAMLKDFKAAGVDPKARNKVMARLDEARLWSKEIIRMEEPGFPVEQQGVCTCPPTDGVVDRTCPVHGAM